MFTNAHRALLLTDDVNRLWNAND